MFKRKQRKTEPEGFLILDYRRYHFNILLYRSAEHYRSWVLFNENVPPDLRDEFKENPRLKLPDSVFRKAAGLTDKTYWFKSDLLVEPYVVSSFGFTEGDLKLAREDYMLFDSEREADQCPFCRINPSGRFMRILSETSKEGTIEGGGVAVPCIHLLWHEDYELLSFEDFVRRGFQVSEGFKRVWRKKPLAAEAEV